jgi:cytochrome c-type biogenesis protein CcmH
MKRLVLVPVFLLMVSATSLAIDTEEPFDDPALQARYDQLIEEFRCLVCQNQAIADSNATLAADLRREIHRMLNEGMSDAEITTFLVERYGDFVLYRPPVKPSTWLLWAAPLLFVGIGALTAFFVLRRRALLVTEGDTDMTLPDKESDGT